jgi:plasmid stabilization system protein ParE
VTRAMKLRWDACALELFEMICAIRASFDPEAARSFVFRVAEVTGRLLTLPESGRPGARKGMWLLPVPGSPYVFVYRVEGETIDILGMIYTDDRAGIWNWGELRELDPPPRIQAGARSGTGVKGTESDSRQRTPAARRRAANRRPARS